MKQLDKFQTYYNAAARRKRPPVCYAAVAFWILLAGAALVAGLMFLEAITK
jgi:hypothetical protein